MSKDVSILADGKLYSGWTNARVARSMDFLTSTFEMSVTIDGDFEKSKWAIFNGQNISVLYGTTVIMLGYIEDIDISYDDASHTINLAGRDKMCDLVDCQRPGSPKNWSNQTVVQLVRNLCSPFGISVIVDSSASSTVLKRQDWTYNEGETIFEAIKRLCFKNGILPISHGDGKLMLSKLGVTSATTSLERGVNILGGGLHDSNKERFKDYYVKGFGFATDQKQTKDYVQPKGDATDSVIGRYRPFVISNDGDSTSGNCKERAKWEAQLRAGNSRTLTYSVAGWEQQDGSLWKLNTKVKVKDPTFKVEGEYLINTIGFEVGEGGVLTALGLVHKEKYEANANLEKIKSPMDGSGILAALGL